MEQEQKDAVSYQDIQKQLKDLISGYSELVAHKDVVIEELRKEVEALKIKITKALEELH